MTAGATMRDRLRIPVAFAALIVWLLITVWGVWTPHDPTPLTDGVAKQPAWSIIGAGAFLLALVGAAGVGVGFYPRIREYR